jgi:DNA-binding SARP family transcriptional activator
LDAGDGVPNSTISDLRADEALPPVLLCLLSQFRLFKLGEPLAVRSGGRTEALLCSLALVRGHGIRRETLIDKIWPGTAPDLAGQSLNSLVHSLCKLLRDALAGEPPILHKGGCYRLNLEAGVVVDVMRFESLLRAGDRQVALGDSETAMAVYGRAVELYDGDLYTSTDVFAVVERERLRALYLTALARLAECSLQSLDYIAGLDYAFRLLASDPCREDGHRLVMRCYMHRGERAQALRHYHLCRQILRTEFNVVPEPATTELFEQIRSRPGSV